MKATSLLTLLSLASNALAWRCLCGYTVNKTDSEYFSIFTYISETDFLHVQNVDPKVSVQFPGWNPVAGDNSTAQTLGYSQQIANVVTNALPKGKWGGAPAGFGDAGLQLWVRHWTEKGLVPVAGVNNSLSLGADGKEKMLYGSYRAGIKFSGVNGTKGVFAWESKEGTREQSIKMTLAARKTNMLTVNVRDWDLENPDNDTSYDMDWISIYNLPEEYHEYRFDWTPDRIDF
jgi:hypothetical protein